MMFIGDLTDTFILRGLDADGKEFFYTGRSGNGWISPSRDDSFFYHAMEVARNKAKNFNRMTALHGLWFVAVRKEGYEV